VQAYNFRLTLTKDPKNWLPYPKPEGYDPKEYELLARYVKHDTKFLFGKYDLLQNGKYAKNNHGAISTDYIGQNYAWPEADYKTRERIFRKHVVYQQGLMWFLTNDPRVPAETRARLAEWGLCRDEFVDTAGWSRQLYVREARRMVSDYVVTERDCRGTRKSSDSVGLGSYGMDSHNCQRVVINGAVKNEGDVQEGGFAPYPVSYRSIVPRRGECENLLVPVCISCSHIAYGSVRMEPVFMLLAQSAVAAAEIAMDGDGVVQNVEYSKLQARLKELGQVIEWTGPVPSARAVEAIAPASLPGIVLDDAEGKKTGEWHPSTIASARKVGVGYLHDGNTNQGGVSIAFTPDLPTDGEYEIFLIAPPNPNRAANAPVTIAIDGKEVTVMVDQRSDDGNGFRSLGRHRLPSGRKTTVTLSNRGASGYVVVDGIQFLPR
ncbi:MAG: FAD-dependent oxidoreductase, partial [Actinomycetota bacterium]